MNLLKITQTNRRWYEIILWWEIRRIPYNIIMVLIGIMSFYISYITIPLVYLIIGFGLNGVYTLGWLVEIILVNNLKKEKLKLNYPKIAFITYLIFSAIIVLGFAVSQLMH